MGVSCIEYNPYKKTALMRHKLSKPMSILINKCFILPNHIDVGCGNGTDVHILNGIYGIEAYGYDKYNPMFHKEELLNKQYNSLSCLYVFNVISSLDEHKELLETIRKVSNNIYICIRSDVRSIKKDWTYSEKEMGYWTRKGSFQRFYNEQTIRDMFGEVEYINNNSSFKLFKLLE